MSDYDSAISALFKLRAPQVPHWTESYKNVTSLRDLMDARRIREQQLQLSKLKIEEEQRQAEDERRTRQILATHPITETTNLTDMLGWGLHPKVAMQLDADIRQRATAKSQFDTAEIARKKAIDDQERARQQRVLGMQAGLLQQVPAEGYQQGATSYETPEMRRAAESDVAQMQGLGVEGKPTMVMPTAAQFPAALGGVVGPKEAQAFMAQQATRQEAADKSAIELEKQQTAQAALFARTITDQAGYDELMKMLPARLRTRFPQKWSTIAVRNIAGMGMTAEQAAQFETLDTPGKIIARKNQPDTPPEEKARLQAMLEERAGYEVAAHPPAVAQLLPTDVANQRVDIAARTAAAGAEAKPPSEGERKVFSFYERVRDAENSISTVEAALSKMDKFDQIRLKTAPSWAQTTEGQLYHQARRQFTEARLRKESGAVISPTEYEDTDKIFFTQPNDDPATKKRKKEARALLMNSMARESGRAYIQAYGEAPPPPVSREPTPTDTGGAPVKVGDTLPNGKKVTKITKVK